MKYLQEIISKIQTAIRSKLWGEIIIKFRDGKPTLISIVERTQLD